MTYLGGGWGSHSLAGTLYLSPNENASFHGSAKHSADPRNGISPFTSLRNLRFFTQLLSPVRPSIYASFCIWVVYDSYMGDMPWLSVPFEGKTRGTIAQLLGVSALPTLLVFDEEQQLITANGRQEIIKDTKAENFPWYPKVKLVVVGSSFGAGVGRGALLFSVAKLHVGRSQTFPTG